MTDFERLSKLQYQLAIQTQENGRINIVMPQFYGESSDVIMWVTFYMPDCPRAFLYQEADFKTCLKKLKHDIKSKKFMKELNKCQLNASAVMEKVK